ncbi:hypothetical protein ACI1VO_31270, partial [Escherichia coli]
RDWGNVVAGVLNVFGAGGLVLKVNRMRADAVMIMADSAREILKQRSNESCSTLKA